MKDLEEIRIEDITIDACEYHDEKFKVCISAVYDFSSVLIEVETFDKIIEKYLEWRKDNK